MKTSKLVSLFHSLTKVERAEFMHYLNSSLFNQTPRPILLAEYLLKNNDPNKEKAFNWVHKNKREKYDDLAMRHVMMRLLQLLKDFMAFKEWQEDKYASRIYLLNALRKKRQAKLQQEVLSDCHRLMQQSSLKDDEYYYYKYRFELEKNTLQQNKDNRIVEPNLPTVIQSMNELFIYSSLKHYCHALNQKNIYANVPEMLYKEELLRQLKINEYRHHPGILIYHTIMLTLSEPENEKHYHLLKTFLSKNVQHFSLDEAREMYVFAQNFCIKQINKGNPAYLKEIFKLYKTTLDAQIAFENGFLSPQSFKNVVATALRLKKVNWCKVFIKEYHKRIVPEHRDNAYNYNLARLYFYEKKYKSCLQLLQKVNYKDAFYGFDSKVLLLKTFYEQKDYEALEHFILSFWMFVKRNKHLSEIHKQSYLHLMSFIRKLVKLDSKEPDRIQKIKKEIKTTQPIADVNWLLEMVEKKA